MDAIRKRKSVRQFLNKPVEDTKLESIILAGSQSPCVTQLHFTVITNLSVLRYLKEKAKSLYISENIPVLKEKARLPEYTPLYNAPCYILVSAPKTEDKTQHEGSLVSASLATENMIIAATSLGLGSCMLRSFIDIFKLDDVRQKSCVPSTDEVHCSLGIGYAEDTSPHVLRTNSNRFYYYK